MLVPPLEARESTACSDYGCPKVIIIWCGNSLQADEKVTTGSWFSITNLVARFRSASLGSDMLPLLSSTVTKSTGVW
jgi:hypothetical protein